MKTIIAGGRDYRLSKYDKAMLKLCNITHVISGGCRGVDQDAIQWAIDNSIEYTVINADWNKYGKSAGPKRNKKMADIAEQVILFPGGKGTASMLKEAKKAKLNIIDITYDHNFMF